MDDPRSGETWRRIADGQLTTIMHVAPLSYFGGYVEHQAKRKTVTSIDGFLKKYEYVKEDHGSD